MGLISPPTDNAPANAPKVNVPKVNIPRNNAPKNNAHKENSMLELGEKNRLGIRSYEQRFGEYRSVARPPRTPEPEAAHDRAWPTDSSLVG